MSEDVLGFDDEHRALHDLLYLQYGQHYGPTPSFITHYNIQMNVDSDNFHLVRKHITTQKLIEKSKYIAFDLEFTGVRFDNNQKDKYDMFLNEKYQKMSSVATKFNIVQIGLTFVVEDQSNHKSTKNQGKMVEQTVQNLDIMINEKSIEQKGKKYIAYPYNFYVFPRQSPTSNPIISMQAGCIQFNTNNNMDWNRWIKKGITYTRISEFNKHLLNIGSSNTNSVTTITNSKCYQQNNFNAKLYGEILGDISEKIRVYVEDIVAKFQGKDVGFKYVIEVPKYCVGVIRRTIEAYASQHELNLMLTKSQIIPLVSIEQQDEQLQKPHNQPENVNLQIEIISQQKKFDEEQKQKEQILGFSLIFQEIWNSGKPLIGHNSLYDILFIYSAFVDELPRDYQNFKKILCDRPGRKFYDTKYLAARLDRGGKLFKKGTSLQQLYKYYKEKGCVDNSSIQLAAGFESYNLDQPNLHQAGFDSYLTSWVFLHLPVQECDEGKLSIFKSYFFMNLRTPGDQIRQDMSIFVIAVVLNNAYVPYQQLRNMRMAQSKLVRDELQKQDLINDVIVIDGFKQIFLSMKELAKNAELIKFLLKLMRNKLVQASNIMSLQSWVKMRAEVFASMPVNSGVTKTRAHNE